MFISALLLTLILGFFDHNILKYTHKNSIFVCDKDSQKKLAPSLDDANALAHFYNMFYFSLSLTACGICRISRGGRKLGS